MLASPSPRKVAIVGYNRIPFARQNTAYVHVNNQQMMTATLDGLIERYKLQGMRIGEVAGGAVIKDPLNLNLMRESVLGTSLDPSTPACDIQQACDTGIESAVYIANKIALGQIDVGIAGGVDSTSNVPLVLGEKMKSILLGINRSKTIGAKFLQFLKIRPGYFSPTAPRNLEPRTGLSMGGHTEITAKHYNIGRREQDEFALDSHAKLARAYEEGFFDDMLTPYQGLSRDNQLRTDSNMEKMTRLKPSFDKVNGSLTAGNSSPLTDGASCILLATEEWATQQKLPVLAYFKSAELAAIEYVQQKQNLLLAPLYASSRMLDKAGLTLQAFDFYEIHEAFAAQVLATLKIWESEELSKQFGLKALGPIDKTKLNMNGSSLAAGHPFAATGGRVLATMAKLLFLKGSGRGFISVCAAGGQGITAILER